MDTSKGWRVFHLCPQVDEKPVPVLNDSRIDIVGVFAGAFRRQNNGTFSFILNVESPNDLGVHVQVVDHVTASASWHKPQMISVQGKAAGMLVQGDQLAATLLLPKIDREIETVTMAKLKAQLNPAGLPLPALESYFEGVAAEPNACVSAIYYSLAARHDRALLLAINSLAAAFFGILGQAGRHLP